MQFCPRNALDASNTHRMTCTDIHTLTHSHTITHTHTKTQLHTNTVYSQILTLTSQFFSLQPSQSANYNTMNCTNFLNFFIVFKRNLCRTVQQQQSSIWDGMGWDPPRRNHTEKSRCFDVVHKRSQWRGKKFQRIMMTSWDI